MVYNGSCMFIYGYIYIYIYEPYAQLNQFSHPDRVFGGHSGDAGGSFWAWSGLSWMIGNHV